jgi:hypothetical protein
MYIGPFSPVPFVHMEINFNVYCAFAPIASLSYSLSKSPCFVHTAVSL